MDRGNDVSIVCIRYGSNGNDFFTLRDGKKYFFMRWFLL